MELKYIFKLFIKWLWLIILIPLVAGAGAYYVNEYKTLPIYEAYATMYIVRSVDDPDATITNVYGDITSAQNAVENYSEIIKSKNVIKEALEKLSLEEYPVERFSGNISLVLPAMDSFVLGISVRDVNPELAADMANKLSEILVERTNQFMKIAVLKVLDIADIPENPSNDETSKNTIIAIMAGIIFCVVIIFIVEYVDSVIIKDEKDVQKYLDLPVFATIPNMKYLKH